MLLHQIRYTFRNLWRKRLFTALHIGGLAIGLSAAWLMWQYTTYEFAFDQQIPGKEHIYRVVSRFQSAEDPSSFPNAGTPEGMWQAAAELPGVELSVPLRSVYCLAVWPEDARRPFNSRRLIARTTNDYFQLVPLQWLAGSAAQALKQPNQVVLARSRAVQYFPNHQPDEMLGKWVRYESFNDTITAQVAGVVEDLNFPTSFIEKELLSAELNWQADWRSVNSNHQTWLVLNEKADPDQLQRQLDEISQRNGAEALKAWKASRSHELQSLAEVHFAKDFESHIRASDKKTLGILSTVALFLLLLACINYINLSTAQLPTRAQEIGIRKTLGGGKSGIMGSFLLETAVIGLLSLGLAALLTYYGFAYFKNDLPEDVLAYADWRQTAFFLLLLLLLVSAIVGLYPGWLMSRFQAISLLKGQFTGNHTAAQNRGGGLRRTLIIFQFFVAQVFILGALVVGRQLHFMQNANLGFDRQAVVTVEAPDNTWRDPSVKSKLPLFASALKQIPGIEQVSLGDMPMSNNYSSNTYFTTDDAGNKVDVNIYRKSGDPELMDLYRVPLVAGRALMESDSFHNFLLNESAVQAFGFESPEAAIGQVISENMGADEPAIPHQIVGVVADFHSMGFTEKIPPIAVMYDLGYVGTINVRLTADWQATLKEMKATWQQFYPNDDFESRFYDETLADIYESDLTLARFINLATGIALFISCLGLFGLATFMTLRRQKEIGIRKILGASVGSVINLLSREFLLLVGIGFVLAVPLSIYFLKDWLSNFAYRIELQWWMFALAGIAALLTALITVSYQSIRAALANPVKTLRSE